MKPTAALAGLATGLLLFTGTLLGNAPANADKYPGDPPGCESTTYGHSLICDGPIQPDGTWQRCAYRRVIYAYQAPVLCRYVNINTCRGPLDFDVPDHHIDY
jgi:hypothetical protein